VVFDVSGLIKGGVFDVNGLMKGVVFDVSGLIKGVVFDVSGLIKGVVFDVSGLIKKVVFDVSGLIKGGLLYLNIKDNISYLILQQGLSCFENFISCIVSQHTSEFYPHIISAKEVNLIFK
jgi:hypothetical protein